MEDRRDSCFAVWELTLRCNLRCVHCGSRAGHARDAELTTAECLDLVGQLVDVGVTRVNLIGGEAFLRRDWLAIVAAIVAAGMRCTLTTGGWGVSESMVRRMADAGLAHVTVSVDGLEATHDTLRGRAGSWRRCLAVMGLVADAGMSVACNTQINRLSAPELPSLYEVLAEAGMRAWQTQLTGPMGHAADRPQLLLQPSELLDLHPMLARIARRAWAEGVQFAPAPNVGYYGPYERVLRGDGHPWAFWRGPAEGLAIIGIESDGSVKADATLPSAAYVAGNVRERSLAEIVEDPRFSFNRGGGSPAGTEHLWGFCRSCEFADLCRGDDVFTAHTFFGRRGNHPYCHHRALVHEGRGVRERLVPDAPASDDPYASGTFRIMLEPSGAAWAEEDVLHFTADRVAWPPDWPDDPPDVDWDSGSCGPEWPLLFVTRTSTEKALPRSGWDDELALVRELVSVKARLDARGAEPEGYGGTLVTA